VKTKIARLSEKIIMPPMGNDSKMARPKFCHRAKNVPKSPRAVEIK